MTDQISGVSMIDEVLVILSRAKDLVYRTKTRFLASLGMTSLRFYTHPKFHLETALKYLPLGSTTVYGTLARPSGSSRSGPFPAVVMVAGSGPTDRDWNSPLLPGTHGSARLLAETLLRPESPRCDMINAQLALIWAKICPHSSAR